MIRVVLPHHLRTLAGGVGGEISIDVPTPITQRKILDALEAKYPMLSGTMRDHVSKQRRPLVRFFVCGNDVSHEAPDAELPNEIARGDEPFFILGAIAGG